MAVWQETFYLIPNINVETFLKISNQDDVDLMLDDLGEIKNFSYTLDGLLKVIDFLPQTQYWSGNAIFFGLDDSDCITISPKYLNDDVTYIESVEIRLCKYELHDSVIFGCVRLAKFLDCSFVQRHGGQHGKKDSLILAEDTELMKALCEAQ